MSLISEGHYDAGCRPYPNKNTYYASKMYRRLFNYFSDVEGGYKQTVGLYSIRLAEFQQCACMHCS